MYSHATPSRNIAVELAVVYDESDDRLALAERELLTESLRHILQLLL